MPSHPTAPDIGDPQAILVDIVRRWNAGATPLSAAAMPAPYASDAMFFGGLPDHFVGQAAIGDYFTQYDGVLTEIHLTLRDMECRVAPPNVLMAQGFADFSFLLIDGRTTHATFRASLVLEREDDVWLIRLHHFSPPPLVSPVPT